jgi:dipeptidyl-peptidase-4
VFAKSFRIRVESFAPPDAAPTNWVVDASGQKLGTLRSVAEEPAIALHQSFETVGSRDYRATVYWPKVFRAGERYPVILSVYGGPHSNQVTRARNRGLLNQWFADRGFIVASLDGRGTPRRGRAWERTIRGDLIAVPLADQVDGLRALAGRHPEMDLGRVGVYGWSFGGYFSAMATLRRPDVFRAGVAGAPVVDWRDYDTYYTERYMDLPELNPRGYAAASVLTYADRLERPLLVLHGTVDDNVYFMNSMKLVDALFRAGKPFEFVPLSGLTHMVPDPLVISRLYGRIATFFEKNLSAEPASGRPAP